MTAPLDDIDWALLAELQRDGRLTYAQLGRLVAMSPSAVVERVRRLEEAGVIVGYRAVVDPAAVGLSIRAVIRLRYPTGNYKPLHDLLDVMPAVVEAHHVTGDDCFVLTVLARDMSHLEQLTGRLSTLGGITSSVVYSSPLPWRAVPPPDAATAPTRKPRSRAAAAPAGRRAAVWQARPS